MKVFDICTGKVKKPRTITILPVPDRVIVLVNKWGKSFQRKSQRHKLDFLNRNKDKYAWDNDDLEDNDMTLVELHDALPIYLPLLFTTPGILILVTIEELKLVSLRFLLEPLTPFVN